MDTPSYRGERTYITSTTLPRGYNRYVLVRGHLEPNLHIVVQSFQYFQLLQGLYSTHLNYTSKHSLHQVIAKKYVPDIHVTTTAGRTERRNDERTHPLIEMRERILKRFFFPVLISKNNIDISSRNSIKKRLFRCIFPVSKRSTQHAQSHTIT